MHTITFLFGNFNDGRFCGLDLIYAVRNGAFEWLGTFLASPAIKPIILQRDELISKNRFNCFQMIILLVLNDINASVAVFFGLGQSVVNVILWLRPFSQQ